MVHWKQANVVIARAAGAAKNPVWLRVAIALLCWALAAPALAFDHQHPAWTSLLSQQVQWNAAGTATTVDYDGMLRNREQLKAYVTELSAVTRADFDGWPQAQRRAFLINAYNALTVELILTRYPRLKSIRDLGSLFSSPWKQRFFTLFGEEQSLDGIEHGLLRGAADFDDPRIHFAVNCASIGCPALRPEAYRAEVLDAQLEDQTRRFFGDRTRNRFDATSATLYLSSILDWYAEDFERAFRGGASVGAFVARYAEQLGIDAPAARRLAAGEIDIEFLDYDWSLNRKTPGG